MKLTKELYNELNELIPDSTIYDETIDETFRLMDMDISIIDQEMCVWLHNGIVLALEDAMDRCIEYVEMFMYKRCWSSVSKVCKKQVAISKILSKLTTSD